ncbi:MAG: hypothetical protein ABSE63_09295 [Thermoguttaceae bacterium]|jgi:hypothetical protein
MKLKISFDKKAIGKFFLEHSEKVLLGAFILVFAVIIYGAAVRRDRFDKNPSDLLDKSSSAKRSLEGERPEMLKELLQELQVREDKGDYRKDADKIAEFNKQGISVKPYECEALDKPLFGQRGKRGQPELYDVDELRAAADFGAFQVVETPGGGPAAPPPQPGSRARAPIARVAGNTTVRGKHWVVITGLVPAEMQANAYRKTFADAIAYNPANDVPTYVDYTVERAEINSPADEKNPNFTRKFNSVDAETEATKDWSQQQPDVVDIKYIDPILTFPLGPLQNRGWGANVAHAPKIPLLNPLGGTDGDAGDRADAQNGADNPPAEAGPAPGQYRGSPGFRGGPRNPIVRTDRGGGYGGESSAYKLLRFFDFTVEPGKSYIYRVSLALKNPNFQVDAGKLENADFAKEKNLYTKLPTASERVDVPKDTQVLVGAAKTEALEPGKFPVVLLTWAQNGRAGYYSLTNVDHGQVLNIKNQTVVPVAPESPSPAPPDAEDVKADLITDATLLDKEGGKKFTTGKDHKLSVPRDMLFMMVNGKSISLMLRDELDDMSEINRITTKAETAPGPGSRGPAIRGATDPRNLVPGGAEPGRGRTPARP